MRTWLLLVSLLVSGLSPLGDRDWIMDHLSRPWFCKLLLRRQKTPGKGLEAILMQTEHSSPFFHTHYWTCRVHNDHGHTHQEVAEIIHRIHFPALAVSPSYEEGNLVLAFPAMSHSLPTLHVICKISHIAMDTVRKSLESWSAWLHHQSTISGNNFPAFVLKKSKTWAPITAAQLHKTLTKRYCTAIVVISYCAESGEIKRAMNIEASSKQEVAQLQARQKQSTQQAVDFKVLVQYDGELFLITQHDFKAAMLHSGSSSMNNSDMSQLKIQRQVATVMKTNEYVDLDKDSGSQKSFQKQLSLKAACVGNADGFSVQRQLLLVSRENKGPINRPKYALRPPQEENNEYFIWKIIMEEETLRCLEAESLRQKSHAHTIKNGRQKILAYIQETHSPQKTHNGDVNVKHMLSDIEEEALIVLFLQDVEKETQTEPYNERKLVPNTDMRRKTVNMPLKELGDTPPSTIPINDFIIEADQSQCKCSSHLLELYTKDRREIISLRSAECVAEVTTVSATTEHSETNMPQENVSENHNINENMTSTESVIPPPPSITTMQTETTAIGVLAEATTANREIQKTTTGISEISTETADGQLTAEPETDSGSNIIKSTTESKHTMTKNLLWGLRMREDIPVITTKLHKGMPNEDRASTNWAETERKDQNNPGATLSKPSEVTQKEAADSHSKPTGDTVTTPLCRGLIHRTKAGWKHCMDRLKGLASKIFSVSEAPETRELEKEPIRDRDHNLLNNDENDHFYYFDGVLKRVQNNFYPYFKRQRHRRKRSKIKGRKERQKTNNQENLLSYIRRLTERNKLNNLK